MSKRQKISGQTGMITPTLLILLAVFFVLATSIMSWALQERKSVLSESRKTKALQVAEAGVDYYKWHLAHDEDDYKDGHTWCCMVGSTPYADPASCAGNVCGPYITDYKDYDNTVIGKYSLVITPPAVGSTVVGVASTGSINEDNNVTKTVSSQLGKKSLARYSFLSNPSIWIGADESVSGPLHSNGGIRFDSDCDAKITSAKLTYTCTNSGCSDYALYPARPPGIWGSAPNSCKQYWHFPDSTIDFDLFTVNMADIKAKAQTPGQGIFLPQLPRTGQVSWGYGYKIVFRADAKVDISIVSTLGEAISYYNDSGNLVSDKERVGLPVSLTTYNMPANGLIFAQDDLWVEGHVKGKVTVAASNLNMTANRNHNAKITINDSIKYEPGPNGPRDGSSALGLMAEGDVLVPFGSPDDLEIDAVMLSQKGHVFRRQYKYSNPSNYNGHDRPDKIIVYGGVITFKLWTWSYVDNNNAVSDGFLQTETIYDNHLVYSPPPSFPTEENFEMISWSAK